MKVEPYLFFEGRCDEAIEFYRNVLNAEVTMLMRRKESPEPYQCPTGTEDMVMHASFRVGDTNIMASDGRCEGEASFQGFALSISVADISAAERMFAALSERGQVLMPLAKTFYSPCFGMTRDRFGVLWMLIVGAQEAR